MKQATAQNKQMRARKGIALLLLLVFAVPLFARAQHLAAAGLSTSAASAVLMEQQSGAVLYAKDADTARKMASTTKIMTAYVALAEIDDLSQTVAVDARAVGVEGTSVYLRAGERITYEDLLYAVLLSSANDAAAALAYAVSGSIEDFAARMNAQAQTWGLVQTHFCNPHGLDAPEHYTTARELATMARYAMQNPTFARIASTTQWVSHSEGTAKRTFVNHNRLLRSYEGAIGVKTGFTKKSGRCLVSAAMREGVQMIAVTLNAGDDWNDHKKMLDYGFSLYERRQILQAGELSLSLPVVGGTQQSVCLQNREELWATVPKSAIGVEVAVEAPHLFFAPVAEGTLLGTARITVGGVPVGEVPLYAQNTVPKQKKPSLQDRLFFWKRQ